MGFFNIYTPSNEEFWGTDPNESNLFTYEYVSPNELLKDYLDMRLFIPCGTKEIGVKVKSSPTVSQLGYMTKFKNAPGLSLVNKDFHEIPWEIPKNDVSLIKDLEKQEKYMLIKNGNIDIIPFMTLEKPLGDTLAGWLYMKALRFDLGTFSGLEYKLKVDKAYYENWLNRTDMDSQLNPILTYPPLGFHGPIEKSDAVKLIEAHDTYPKHITDKIDGKSANYYFFQINSSYAQVKVSIESLTFRVKFHLNASTTRYLNSAEINKIAAETIGQSDPVVNFISGLTTGSPLYITVVNLSQAVSRYRIFVELIDYGV